MTTNIISIVTISVSLLTNIVVGPIERPNYIYATYPPQYPPETRTVTHEIVERTTAKFTWNGETFDVIAKDRTVRKWQVVERQRTVMEPVSTNYLAGECWIVATNGCVTNSIHWSTTNSLHWLIWTNYPER